MADRTYNKVKIDGVVKLDLSSDTVTADKLLKNTTAHNHLGAAITGTYEPPTFTTQTKSATPTESAQDITPDSGYNGLSKVTVGAISSTYVGSGVSKQAAKTVTPNSSTQTAVSSGKYTTGDITVAAVPTETKSISSNGTYTPTSGKYFSSVTVAVPTSPTLQEKSATPSETAQDIVADTGYDGLSKVSVGAISNTYIGSGITKKAAATITPSEEPQTIAAGQYLNGAQTISAISSTYVGSDIARKSSTDLTASSATVSVPAGYYESNASKSIGTGALATPTINTSTGVVTASVGTAGYIATGTSTQKTLSLTTKAAATITPTTSSQTAVAKNVYTLGAITVGAIPSNYVDVSGATNVTAANMLSGTKAHNSSGTLISGSMTNVGKQEVKLTGTSATTITKGYHDGTGSAIIDTANIANLTAANIKKNVSILGVAGSYEGSGSSGPVIQYSTSVTKITNKTSYTAAGGTITVQESGNYKCSWVHYAAASSSSYYLTRLYKNGSAVGSTHASPAYNGTASWVATESSISLSAGDKVQVYARTRNGSSYYTVAGMLVIEKI